MSETESRYEPMTADEIASLLEAGAAPEFIMLARYDDGGRNLVREEARRALGREDPSRAHFGHFAGHMWRGDLYFAMQRADFRNRKLLFEVFGLEYINAAAQREGKSEFKVEDGQVVYK